MSNNNNTSNSEESIFGVVFFIILIFVIYVIGVITAEESFSSPPTWVWIVDGILTALLIFVMIPSTISVVKEESKKEKEQFEKMQKETEQLLLDFKKDEAEFIQKYGHPDKYIQFNFENIYYYASIIAIEKEKLVFILGKPYKFDDIISCQIKDDATTYFQAVSSVDNSDVLARSAIGNLLGGKSGEIIGGTTASRKTVIAQSPDTINHHYWVIINVNDIKNPIIKIDMSYYTDKVEEIFALMQVIINRNK